MKLKTVFATLLCGFTLSAQAADKLVVYNWSEYIPEGVLEKFTKETGIEVDYSTYESNEVMYSKLKLQKGKGYDIVVPSTYYISKMGKEGLLQPIDKSKLSNLKNLNPTLMNKEYDPDNKYSVPYLWGSTGIGINVSSVDPKSITSWADLWDPKWKNKLLLTDDVREVFHMALKINGHSANSTDPEEIKQAYEKLKQLMPNVLVFNGDAPREPFMAGDVSLGMIWNGEVIMAQEEDPDIQYIYPAEGAAFWVDSFAIPSGAANAVAAHKFIDFMMRPEIAKLSSEEIGYATPNLAGLKLLEPSVRENKTIFPDEAIVAKGDFQTDVGEAMKLYNDYWQKLKAGQ
ncbi:extracellular solute-binding protein [Ketobacter sp. MCCC 1A13808]|uniref:extracellular solute-binding protein n=1 Tax=Ketobacter sp. MCCC 1A13808 TaxID=2602738 RepID=UPI000F1BA8C3|nr:extracellular solute-binding protein [Ketobacter sp. MCCC 1A13808]MVF13254.1 extracellular solute-binding protein [Ketobacter sp. MCCC 1A13808]RLP54247.1 MAG: extracellular solute-binding protein [Ketobacter sp.]